jgi:cytochrome P450
MTGSLKRDYVALATSTVTGCNLKLTQSTFQWTLSVISFYILSQPTIQAKLASELQHTDPTTLSWAVLEKLPYLSAVVAEGLRLSYGVSTRIPRVPRDEHLVYRGEVKGHGKVEYVIPKGTAIGSKYTQLDIVGV